LCGINGFNWSDERLLLKMNETVRHRGPDDEGCYLSDGISLGNTRLSIQDLSSAGHQPMKYTRGNREVYLVHNGEIYNFEELRAELEGHGYAFVSHSDSEVILASYLEWGFDCVRRFNGMWAFAIYDVQENIVFLSRDRFGIKPLYYHYDGAKLIFSSEIKAILLHEIQRVPNDRVIFDFLNYGLVDHTEDTFFEGIKRLMPGSNAVLELPTRNLRLWKYYDLNSKAPIGNYDNCIENFRSLFYRAIKGHMVSDVVVGSCLSGGLDSSGIVCAMRRCKPESELQVFSLGFPGDEVDETRYQKVVAENCGARLNSITFALDELIKDFEDLIRTQEEPFVSLSIYGQYRVAKLIGEHRVKVVLDGQGGDETFGGYEYQFAYYFYELLRRGKLIRLAKEIVAYCKKHGSYSAITYWLGLLLPSKLKEFLISRDRYYLQKTFTKTFGRPLDRKFQRKTLNESLAEAVTYSPLPGLLRYEDKNSMRWSVESRVPFVDHSMVEYANSMPIEWKIRDGSAKIILRHALAGIIPKIIVDRQDKIGFGVPERAASTAVRQFIEGIIESDSFQHRPYWNAQKVSRLFHKSFSSKRGTRIFTGEDIWRIVILEMWLRMYVDKPTPNS